MEQQVIIIDSITIKQDAEGRYCLNDLHRAAGDLARHAPALWERQATDLIIELEKGTKPYVIVKTRGRNGGTYVAKELVYAYATWISPVFHLKVIRAYDRLATQGVAVHENAAADLLANPLKYFEAVFKQAQVLDAKNKQLEAEKALLLPKADVFDTVVADKRMTVAAVVRMFPGVNTNMTKRDLTMLGYLRATPKGYRVRAEYRDTLFSEKMVKYKKGTVWESAIEVMVLADGKELLTKLYKDRKLTMKVGY